MIRTTDINNQAGYGNKFGEWGVEKSVYIYKDLTTKHWSLQLNEECGYTIYSYADLTKYEAVELINEWLFGVNIEFKYK